ncbi:FadR/GntR family transcriptional regulator [Bacillus weihaiensis]|uniref:FadR/GntR family transcriptional regulator n=1 Tax=Bacillus weihaiensis TaxID=1547283 RepID=UPI00235461E9|nr:GntR family transcriptional regulator [Bacillus weihaiensis]
MLLLNKVSEGLLTTPQSKAYIEILSYIRKYISENHLSYGDKIPSEREFADKLKVGRSSVREALRALELLGMIETRRGEGTFLKDFREHTLIELLGTFILEGTKAIDDILELNTMLENNAISLILKQEHGDALLTLKREISVNGLTRYETMSELVQLANNHLLYRVWRVLNEYVSFVSTRNKDKTYSSEALEHFVHSIYQKNEEQIKDAYTKLALTENVE